MNTIVNPTKNQVAEFCQAIHNHLMGAIDRGATVEIGIKQITKDVMTLETNQAPVDALYIGAKFKASFRERGF